MMMRCLACEGRRARHQRHHHDRDQRSHSILTSPADFPRLLAAVFNDVEGNLAALDKAIGARLPNGLDMYKYVVVAVVRGNKAVTLRDVKPLHSPARHARAPLDSQHQLVLAALFEIMNELLRYEKEEIHS